MRKQMGLLCRWSHVTEFTTETQFCGCACVFTCNFKADNGGSVRRRCLRDKNTLETICLSLSAESATSQWWDMKLPKSLKASWMLHAVHMWRTLWWWWYWGPSITSMDISSFWLQWWQDLRCKGIWQWYSESTEKNERKTCLCMGRLKSVSSRTTNPPSSPPTRSLCFSLTWPRTCTESKAVTAFSLLL